MAFSSTIRLVFTGDSTGAERAAKRTEDSLDRLNATGKKAFGGLGESANVLTGALGVGGLAYGLKSLNDAARESELSTVRMRTQFKALGLDFEQHRARVDEVIAAQSRLAALDDEELADSFTTILRVTGDVNRSLELNALAADIARGRQIDLASAGEIVAKVAGGNTGILARYGIQIEKGATATEALGELQRLFAGQAEAYGRSNAGAADRASVAWENAREALGEKLLPVISRLATFLSDDLIPAVTMFAGGIDTVVDALGGWKVAAAFILSGLLATRLLAVVSAVRTYTTATTTAAAATTALGAASTTASAGALTGFLGLARFLKFGLPAAAAVAVYEMRKPIGDFFDWMTRKLEGVLGWIPGYSVKKADEAAKAVELRSKELMPLAGQTAGGAFYDGWQNQYTLSLRTGKLKLRKAIAKPLSEAGELAGTDAGEDTAKAFSLSLQAYLRVKFPPAVIGALAPTWSDIAKAAEAAGIDVGNAFVTGYASAVVNASTGTNQFANAGSYAVAPGQQLQGTIFPIPSGVDTSIIGTPGSGTHNQSDWQSRNAIDIAAKPGTPVLAVEDGQIDHVGGTDPDRGTVSTPSGKKLYGYQVTLNGVSGTQYFYTHLDAVTVQAGANVKAGDVIGLVAAWKGGGTPHVHFATSQGDPRNIGNRVQVDYVPPAPGKTTPGSTSSPSSPGSTTTPRPQTSFPGISGISDRLQGRFDEANQEEGEALRYDPKTKKWVAVKVGPDMKALKRLADHLRTKVLPGIQKRIDVLKKRIARLVKKKGDGTLIATLRNKLKALQAERDEITDLWREVIDTWKDLKEAADEDDDTGDEPVTDASGPVGGQPGLPGHEPADPEPADTPSAPATSRDVEAELAQANLRAAVAQRSAQIAGGFVSAIGIGVDANGNTTVTAPSAAPTIIVQSLQLPNAAWLDELARQASQGVAGQGYVPSSTVSLGV